MCISRLACFVCTPGCLREHGLEHFESKGDCSAEYRCCSNCVANRVEEDLSFELALALAILKELSGYLAVASIIDLLRGSSAKRSENIQRTATLQKLCGKGQHRDFTWWFAFLHGPVRYHGFLTHHPLHPNRLILTHLGDQRERTCDFRAESKLDDDWPEFMTHIPQGMKPRPSRAGGPSRSLTKAQQIVFEAMVDELDRVANDCNTLACFLVAEDDLRRFILTTPPPSEVTLLADHVFRSVALTSFPQVCNTMNIV